MTRVYFKGSTAALVVFDVSEEQNLKRSLDSVAAWKQDIDLKVKRPDGGAIPVLLLANKCDIKHELTAEALAAFSAEHGFTDAFFTSAKESKNVQLVMERISTEILKHGGMAIGSKGPGAGGFSVTVPEENAGRGACCG